MDRIEVPFIWGNVGPAKVFDRMAESGVHAAIVAGHGRKPMLVTNFDVDEAIERGFRRISQIQGMPVHVLEAEAEAEEWEEALDEALASYGVVAEHGLDLDFGGIDFGTEIGVGRRPTFTIITRHEPLVEKIRSAGRVCRCVKFKHKAPPGAPCPFCHSTVRCA